MPPGQGRSPLRGRYLVQQPIANGCIRLVDAMLARMRRAPMSEPVRLPKKILLCNGAHLGDVVLSTAMLPMLKAKVPDIHIGLLVGSWALCAVKNHPFVDTIHVVDHWKLNRTRAPLWRKLRSYVSSRALALREIKRQQYEVAVDLYYYFPNSIGLLWQAGIPVRIGYWSGGMGPLLTHALDWTEREQQVIDYQADLFRFIPGFATEERQRLTPVLGGARHPDRVAPDSNLRPLEYLVVHMGAGSRMKQWPAAKWRRLTESLSSMGHLLIFTGTGPKEINHAKRISAGVRRAQNLSGLLEWQDFVSVVRNARALVGIDSVAGHVAAAAGTPFVVVSTGINHPSHWAPRGNTCGHVLIHSVSCQPCYLSRGCREMSCVRGVEVEEVVSALNDVMRRDRRKVAA